MKAAQRQGLHAGLGWEAAAPLIKMGPISWA